MRSVGIDEQLEAKRLDESRHCGRLLTPTRVVEEEAGERRAPIFQHPHKCSTREVRRRYRTMHERRAIKTLLRP